MRWEDNIGPCVVSEIGSQAGLRPVDYLRGQAGRQIVS